MADRIDHAALDGAAQDLRDAIASTAMLGVSQRCREYLREHADAAIALHRREIDAQARLVEGLQYRLKLAQEERDRMSERLQAALDERDDERDAHAAVRERLMLESEKLARASAQVCCEVMAERDAAQSAASNSEALLTRALDLLARLRPGEPRSFPALCQFQDEIDTLMAECRGDSRGEKAES